MPRIKHASVGPDGELSIELCSPAVSADDTGTTSYLSHAWRVRIPGEQKSLYFYWRRGAEAMAQALQEENIDSWIEEKEEDHTGVWWTRKETV